MKAPIDTVPLAPTAARRDMASSASEASVVGNDRIRFDVQSMQQPQKQSRNGLTESDETRHTIVEASSISTALLAIDDAEIKREQGSDTINAQELKRLRNREWMRRTRQRKSNLVAGMKQQVAELERQLEGIFVRQRQAMDAVDSKSHTQLRDLFDSLQGENTQLRRALRGKEQLRDVIAPLLEQEQERKVIDGYERLLEEVDRDQFPWLRHVSPIIGLKSLSSTDLANLIQRSCAEILASANHAETSIQQPNRVLGWSDKRIVSSQRVHFMFSKDFAHQDVVEAERKSWETSTNPDKVSAFTPRQQSLVVLQRWGDEAAVLARNLDVHSKNDDGVEIVQNFCTVFIVFRLKTADGCLVGTRTLCPQQVQEALVAVGERQVVYIDLCYALLFSPLTPGSTVGCNVRFGGHAGNGTEVYARISAMDALMAALRWENHCIGPLNRLTSS